MECHCYLRNVQDFERRFGGEPCKSPVIPFGAMVEYNPISLRHHSRLHQFGIILGYALIAGRNWIGYILSQTLRSWKTWTRQNFVLEDSTERRQQRRKLSGTGQGIRQSTSIRDQPVRGEERKRWSSSLYSMHGRPPLQEGGTGDGWRSVQILLSNRLEMLVFRPD